jgi:hypothetical protein
MAIPFSLIWMANFKLTHAAINAIFKSLSIFAIAIATTRLSVQYSSEKHSVDYTRVTFWLMVEATVAVIMASVSSYRIVVLHYLTSRSAQGMQLAEPARVDDRCDPSTRAKSHHRHEVAKITNAPCSHGPLAVRAGNVPQ